MIKIVIKDILLIGFFLKGAEILHFIGLNEPTINYELGFFFFFGVTYFYYIDKLLLLLLLLLFDYCFLFYQLFFSYPTSILSNLILLSILTFFNHSKNLTF
jgi:hypothetical protein